MNLNELTSSQLKQAIKLIERKENLLKEIAKIDALLKSGKDEKVASDEKPSKKQGRPKSKAKSSVKAIPSKVAIKAEKKSKDKSKTKSNPKSTGKSSKTMAELVIDYLKEKKVPCKPSEIAAALKLNKNSLGVWFSTSGKKNPQLLILGKGLYQYNAGATAQAAPAKKKVKK